MGLKRAGFHWMLRCDRTEAQAQLSPRRTWGTSAPTAPSVYSFVIHRIGSQAQSIRLATAARAQWGALAPAEFRCIWGSIAHGCVYGRGACNRLPSRHVVCAFVRPVQLHTWLHSRYMPALLTLVTYPLHTSLSLCACGCCVYKCAVLVPDKCSRPVDSGGCTSGCRQCDICCVGPVTYFTCPALSKVFATDSHSLDFTRSSLRRDYSPREGRRARWLSHHSFSELVRALAVGCLGP